MALEQLDQQIIRTGGHYITELRLLPDRIAELVAVRLHSGNKSIEIIRLDPQMMECTSSARLRGLRVYLDETIPQPEPYVAHTRRLLVPDYGSVKHLLEKLDGGRKVRREDVYVVKAYSHDGPVQRITRLPHLRGSATE